MQLFLGIDGGGSRTEAWLGDEQGRTRAKAVAGPSNPFKVGVASAKRELLRAARAVLRDGCSSSPGRRAATRPSLIAVCAGVAGAGDPTMRGALLAWLRRSIPALHHLLVTDAEIALHAAIGDAAGMILVAGTGSIAYGRDQGGKIHRAGGWGALFDDAGSGYDLGRRSIMAALREFDGRGERTLLTGQICRALKLNDIIQVVAKELSPSEVAGLFPLVIKAAREGDGVARSLLAEAASDLACLALAVAKRLDGPPTFPLVCAGGVFRSSSMVRRSFARFVHQSMSAVRVRMLRSEPVEGALAMARKAASQRPS